MSTKYSDEILNKAQLCGQCQFTEEETEAIIEKKLEKEIQKRYLKGILEAQLSVRRALLQKASDGDTAAQKEFQKLCLQFNNEDE